jgi:hypothetical protein
MNLNLTDALVGCYVYSSKESGAQLCDAYADGGQGGWRQEAASFGPRAAAAAAQLLMTMMATVMTRHGVIVRPLSLSFRTASWFMSV